jgi:predicted nucleotidyltransferase
MNVSFENLVEGYFIITSDNLVFEVKGVVHPKDRIIAYLRYVPEENQKESGLRYRKIYDLSRREDYLKSNYPEYLWFSKVHGRIVQSVAREKIVTVLSPLEYLAHTKKRGRTRSELQEATNALVKKLVHWNGISWMDIGVTGSQLLGIATEKSDIDLVVYGKAACRKFYDNMSDNYNKIQGVKPYSGDLLDAHLTFRWGELVRYHDILGKIESKKVLQGLFNGHEFFIRLVKRPNETDEYYGKMQYEMMDYYRTCCIVKDDSDSIFTPCVYTVESSGNRNLKRLVSYRGRFTEQITKGMSARVKGRLERVTDTTTGDSFQQLVLGENSTDYLLPG